MGAETTQIRISKTLNAGLVRLAEEMRAAGHSANFTKEQLTHIFLSDCIEAVDAATLVDTPLSSIASVRKQLGRAGLTLNDLIASRIEQHLATHSFLPHYLNEQPSDSSDVPRKSVRYPKKKSA